MRKPNDTIVILGAGLQKEASGWQTTLFSEAASYGALGGRLRVIAAWYLYKSLQTSSPLFVASGGHGTLPAGAPTVAWVIQRELAELGVRKEHIVKEERSRNTYEQLRECDSLIAERGWKQMAIVSNEYHLPRIQAMIEHAPKLLRLKRGFEQGTIRLVSAEKVTTAHDPAIYAKLVEEAYASKAMKKRIASEKKGILKIQAGTYAYGSDGDRIIVLRKATLHDARFLYDLRNEEAVRQASFSTEVIPFKQHARWFQKKLDGNDSIIFIAEIDGVSAGQVRFDIREDREADINVAISQDFRGKGYGSRVVNASSGRFFIEFPKIRKIHAFIKPGNETSLKVFEGAGYRRIGTAIVKGKRCVEMIYTR